jgi:putative FmdB family regulatory protein
MPLYEYHCSQCRTVLEVRHGIGQSPGPCPTCQGSLERVFTSPRLNVGNYSSPSAARYAKLTEDEIAARGSVEHESARISKRLPAS